MKLYITSLSFYKGGDSYRVFYENASELRRKKADACVHEDDRHRSLLASYLLDKALGEHDLNERDMRYSFTANGKPSFTDYPQLHFNISHSGDYVLCAFSSSSVGVDIECKNRPNMKIAHRYFSEGEKKYINTFCDESEQGKAFCRIWTLKESYIKATGTGLGTPLNSFEIIPGTTKSLECNKKTFYFCELEYKGACIALCSEEPIPTDIEIELIS